MSDKPGIRARFLLTRPSFTLDVDLALAVNGITVLQGESGCGKTTVLRCLAGLEKPNKGFLQVNGTTWQDDTIFLPTHKRSIGYVFQEDSLFEHLTVQRNILFGCKDKRHIPSDLMPLVQILGISPLLGRMPQELSGGERQRVAIARALAINPDILLMDEPLSSLDSNRKSEILPYIEQIRDSHKLPIVYVTHDRFEATRLATELIELHAGKVVSN